MELEVLEAFANQKIRILDLEQDVEDLKLSIERTQEKAKKEILKEIKSMFQIFGNSAYLKEENTKEFLALIGELEDDK